MSLPQGMYALPQSLAANFLHVPITAVLPTAAGNPADSASSCALLAQPMLGGMQARPLLQDACGELLAEIEMQQGPPSLPQACMYVKCSNICGHVRLLVTGGVGERVAMGSAGPQLW
jgi:hypothetical protein